MLQARRGIWSKTVPKESAEKFAEDGKGADVNGGFGVEFEITDD